MIPHTALETLAQERLATLRHEAHLRRLIYGHRPSLRTRLALELKALAERLEPEIAQPAVRPHTQSVGRP